MRVESFGQGLAFAALAAVGWCAVEWTLVPTVDASVVTRLYLSFSVVAFLWCTRPSRMRTLALLIGALGVGASFSASSLGAASAWLAATIALNRSLGHENAWSLRSVLTEAGIAVSALAMGAYLLDDTTVGRAFALWGFFLVQGVRTLMTNEVRYEPGTREDPFDIALRATREVLDAR